MQCALENPHLPLEKYYPSKNPEVPAITKIFQKEGRGVAPCWPGTWGEGTPHLKKRREGGWGSPPSPPCRQPGSFLHDRNLWFVWNLRCKESGLRILGALWGSPGRALKGEGGDPLLARHMGGGYPPLEKKKRGGVRATPLPPKRRKI